MASSSGLVNTCAILVPKTRPELCHVTCKHYPNPQKIGTTSYKKKGRRLYPSMTHFWWTKQLQQRQSTVAKQWPTTLSSESFSCVLLQKDLALMVLCVCWYTRTPNTWMPEVSISMTRWLVGSMCPMDCTFNRNEDENSSNACSWVVVHM